MWLETFTKRPIRRGTTRIPLVGCDQAKRGCASRVPLPPGVTARRTGGLLALTTEIPRGKAIEHCRGQGRATDRSRHPRSVASRAIEGSVMGEGEGSGGGDGGARGALSPVGGSKGPEPLASPNVIHWVGWLPFTTRCGAGLAAPPRTAHGTRHGKAIERCRGQGRATDRSGPRLRPAR